MNFFELDISYFQRANQLTLQEILFLGVFHGAVFSLPFSAPLLICFRRFLLDGFKMGTIALFGTLFGQLSFLLFIFLGFRPLIQCWYIFEPFLAFVGMSLALKLATDFFHQKNFGLESSVSEFSQARADGINGTIFAPFASFLNSFNIGKPILSFMGGGGRSRTGLNIFCFQFLFMLLNPAFPATSTRLILGQDLLDGMWGISPQALGMSPVGQMISSGGGYAPSSLYFGLFYALGFIVGSIILVSFFVCIFQFIQVGEVVTLNGGTGAEPSFKLFNPLSKFLNPVFLNKAFVFLIIGCLLQGTIQYSWRLFTQYPIDFIGWNSFSTTKTDLRGPSLSENLEIGTKSPIRGSDEIDNLNTTVLPGLRPLQREFPSFDSNIRHRDKNLPVERHIPVEKVNARRTLSGRPPLNEEQKSDAYLKYNSFFLNKIEQSLEDAKIKFRTPDFHFRTYEEISQLQKMKERYLRAQALVSGYKTSIGTPQISKAHPLENTTKGKPKFSYIRELLDKRGGSSQDGLYIHDDIQIYNALFKILS
jgi:hypothetical protein